MATAALAARKKDLVQELNRYIEQKEQYTQGAQSRNASAGAKGPVKELSPSEKRDGAFMDCYVFRGHAPVSSGLPLRS